MTNNFHKASEEDDNNSKSVMSKLNDVISGKTDPHELYKDLKTDDDHMDVDEMLKHGHINSTRTQKTQKMKEELSKLMEKNKF
mmetsp:Transcript_99356/g.214366  ORF Transcript_99356/g.214366 Transcript_99356/m.214366 type:complete len:83 (+) Transcript_99356:340-588(+)